MDNKNSGECGCGPNAAQPAHPLTDSWPWRQMPRVGGVDATPEEILSSRGGVTLAHEVGPFNLPARLVERPLFGEVSLQYKSTGSIAFNATLAESARLEAASSHARNSDSGLSFVQVAPLIGFSQRESAKATDTSNAMLQQKPGNDSPPQLKDKRPFKFEEKVPTNDPGIPAGTGHESGTGAVFLEVVGDTIRETYPYGDGTKVAELQCDKTLELQTDYSFHYDIVVSKTTTTSKSGKVDSRGLAMALDVDWRWPPAEHEAKFVKLARESICRAATASMKHLGYAGENDRSDPTDLPVVGPLQGLRDEIKCVKPCVPVWTFLGCTVLSFLEDARWYDEEKTGPDRNGDYTHTIKLMTHLSGTLRFRWRVQCLELIRTASGAALASKGAIGNDNAPLGHYRGRWSPGRIPAKTAPAGCCCVAKSVAFTNIRSICCPGGRWGHAFDVVIRYWYKRTGTTEDCSLKWSEWSDDFPQWMKDDPDAKVAVKDSGGGWIDISRAFPNSPIHDAWNGRSVECLSEDDVSDDDLSTVVIPFQSTVPWNNPFGEAEAGTRELWTMIELVGCEGNARACLRQQLVYEPARGPQAQRSGVAVKVDCDPATVPDVGTPVPTADSAKAVTFKYADQDVECGRW